MVLGVGVLTFIVDGKNFVGLPLYTLELSTYRGSVKVWVFLSATDF